MPRLGRDAGDRNRAGQMVSAWLKITRNDFTGSVSFDVDNLPHGIIVADIGLNGVLIPEGQSERQVFSAVRIVGGGDGPALLREGKGSGLADEQAGDGRTSEGGAVGGPVSRLRTRPIGPAAKRGERQHSFGFWVL